MAVPTDIADLTLWLDATQEGFANGAAVATWTDRSGAGNHATQPTATYRPEFEVGGSAINGLSSVRFRAADLEHLILPDSMFDTGGGSSFLVGEIITTPNPSSLFLAGQERRADGDGRQRWYIGNTDTPSVLIAAGGNGFSSNAPVSFTFSHPAGEAFLAVLQSNGSTVDGTRRCPTETESASASISGAGIHCSIGVVNHTRVGIDQPSSLSFMDGRIGEIVHYDRRITSNETGSVIGYLAAKWSIVCGGWQVGSVAIP